MAPPTPAADALFAEHAPALRNFLGARCRDPDLAADLLQETAARLVAAGPRLDANGNPGGGGGGGGGGGARRRPAGA